MKFKDIIGHNSIKKRLVNSVNESKISHAQLFLGKEGSGSLALAIAYAQYISCQNKQAEDSCGECSSCIKYEKLVHPDLHFVYPVATNNDVKKDPISAHFLSQWREINQEDIYFSLEHWQEKLETGNKQLLISKNESVDILKALSLKTYEAEYKIMIIWYPERFNIASANKLLKIIEEPPKKTLFLLVAYDAEQIISTILSRTQLVRVGRIEEEELKKALISRYQLSESEATKIAHFSNGNYIEAKNLAEHSESEEYFYQLFTEWMRSAFKGDVPGLIDWTDNVSRIGREKQKQFLHYCLHVFRESLMRNYGDEEIERISSMEQKFIGNFAPYIHGANCLEVVEMFNDASYHIERNANPKILFLDISLKLTKYLRVKPPEFVD